MLIADFALERPYGKDNLITKSYIFLFYKYFKNLKESRTIRLPIKGGLSTYSWILVIQLQVSLLAPSSA